MLRRRRFGLLPLAALTLVLIASIGQGTASSARKPPLPPPAPSAAKAILFASDGMRQDFVHRYVDEGVMPTFENLLDNGVEAANNGLLQGFPPNTGVGWTTLATGTWPSEHGSTNNTFHRTGEANFNNSTSFAATGIVQADHIAQAAERAGKTVVAMEWVAARSLTPALQGPVVDFRSFFGGRGLTLVGFDPSAERWRDRYAADTALVADFFSASAVSGVLGARKAKVVTSIAMFYDLERPLEFAEAVADILADDGVWHLEQSYLPRMLGMNAYDTVCHEHLEYYALEQIQWVAEKIGLTVLDVEMNDVNGGSFAITLAKRLSSTRAEAARVDRCLGAEAALAMDSLVPFRAFASRVTEHRDGLLDTLERLRARKQTVLGYGASTKGNVILQYAGVDERLLPAIAEVNADKFGCVTPGTWIPIISEADAHARRPDHFLVLPWHFRSNLIRREAPYLAGGGKLIFPLPEIEVVSA